MVLRGSSLPACNSRRLVSATIRAGRIRSQAGCEASRPLGNTKDSRLSVGQQRSKAPSRKKKPPEGGLKESCEQDVVGNETDDAGETVEVQPLRL
jgi:hypothetical protein